MAKDRAEHEPACPSLRCVAVVPVAPVPAANGLPSLAVGSSFLPSL
jgi:hypothetical protein